MRALVVAAIMVVFLSLVGPVAAQTGGYGAPLVTQRFALSSVGPSVALSLTAGQSVCSVVILNTTSFSGLSMRAQAASDGPYLPSVWNNVSAIDGGGMGLAGTYVGSISSVGITNFRVNVTFLSSGTVTGVMSCSSAQGSGQTVTIANSPAPTFTPTATNIGANAGQPVIGYNYGYNKTNTRFDSLLMDPSDVLEVTEGGTHIFRLSSASSASCTSIATGAGRFVQIYNTGPATTIYPTFYDEGSSPGCATADVIYGDGTSITIPAASSTVIKLNVPISNGLAYKLSAGLTAGQQLLISTFGLGY